MPQLYLIKDIIVRHNVYWLCFMRLYVMLCHNVFLVSLDSQAFSLCNTFLVLIGASYLKKIIPDGSEEAELIIGEVYSPLRYHFNSYLLWKLKLMSGSNRVLIAVWFVVFWFGDQDATCIAKRKKNQFFMFRIRDWCFEYRSEHLYLILFSLAATKIRGYFSNTKEMILNSTLNELDKNRGHSLKFTT